MKEIGIDNGFVSWNRNSIEVLIKKESKQKRNSTIDRNPFA